jgi:transposase-like protein
MSILCKKCGNSGFVKNGMMKGKQRYRCKKCGYNFTEGDKRERSDKIKKQLVVKMYLNNCGFRRISEILDLPLATVFYWIKKAGQIVDEMVREKKESDAQNMSDIEILEMDELYTYVKKNQEKTGKQGRGRASIPEYGLLLIGSDLRLLRLQ